MNALDLSMIHTCNIIKQVRDQKLGFAGGSSAYTVSNIVYGTVSNAEGKIKSWTLSSGSWTLGNAAGYIMISNVSGIFEAGEALEELVIPGNTGGSAHISSISPETNEVGTPVYSSVSTKIDKCLFTKISITGGAIVYQKSGPFVSKQLIVFLPSYVIVKQGDRISSIEPGFTDNYKVEDVDTLFEFNSTVIDHIEAYLSVYQKEGV